MDAPFVTKTNWWLSQQRVITPLQHPTREHGSPGSAIGRLERSEQDVERLGPSSDIGEQMHKAWQEVAHRDSKASSIRSCPALGPIRPTVSNPDLRISGDSQVHRQSRVISAAKLGGWSPDGAVSYPTPPRFPGRPRRSGSWPGRYGRKSTSTMINTCLVNLPAPEEGRTVVSPVIPGAPTSPRSAQWQRKTNVVLDDTAQPDGHNFTQEKMRNGSRVINLQGEPRRVPSSISESARLPSGPLFRDFDGVHYDSVVNVLMAEDICGDEGRNMPAEEPDSSTHSEVIEEFHVDERDDKVLGQIPPQNQSQQSVQLPPMVPSMVYYPAPVPIMLNLPNRFSGLHTSDVHADRRAQVLGLISAEARISATWLPQEDNNTKGPNADSRGISPQRNLLKQHHNVMNTRALPPQLRASVFFDHQPIPQDIEIQDGSAVETLENLFDASAMASVEALGGHHSTGSADVKSHGNEHTLQSTTAFLDDCKSAGQQSLKARPDDTKPNARKKRTAWLFGKRSSTDPLRKLRKKSISKLSLGVDKEEDALRGHDALADQYHTANLADEKAHATPTPDRARSPSIGASEIGGEYTPDARIVGFPEHEYNGDFSGPQVHNGTPTNLLAELQLRKQKLKERNRTAVPSFAHGGMYSTLLQLEEVAQVEKKRRMAKPTALAWEDPDVIAGAENQQNDDDIPLGVLFPTKNRPMHRLGQSNSDRPLGLLAKRDFDDNEPLSRRRNRLKGISPNRPPAHATPPIIQGDEEPAQEGETLAQRTRRLRRSKALDDATEDTKSRPASASFATEMLNHLGIPTEGPTPAPTRADTPPKLPQADPEEETLAQRRRRLQAEAQTRQLSGGSHDAQQTTHTPPAARRAGSSGLLGQSELQQASRRQHMHEQKARCFSTGWDVPLARFPGHATPQVRSQIMPVVSARPNYSGGGVNKDGFRGVVSSSNRALNMAYQGAQSNIALGDSGAGYGGYGVQSAYAGTSNYNYFAANSGLQTQQQGMAGVYGMPAGMYNPAMTATMMQTQIAALSARQREMIDRWRESVLE